MGSEHEHALQRTIDAIQQSTELIKQSREQWKYNVSSLTSCSRPETVSISRRSFVLGGITLSLFSVIGVPTLSADVGASGNGSTGSGSNGAPGAGSNAPGAAESATSAAVHAATESAVNSVSDSASGFSTQSAADKNSNAGPISLRTSPSAGDASNANDAQASSTNPSASSPNAVSLDGRSPQNALANVESATPECDVQARVKLTLSDFVTWTAMMSQYSSVTQPYGGYASTVSNTLTAYQAYQGANVGSQFSFPRFTLDTIFGMLASSVSAAVARFACAELIALGPVGVGSALACQIGVSSSTFLGYSFVSQNLSQVIDSTLTNFDRKFSQEINAINGALYQKTVMSEIYGYPVGVWP